MLIRILILCLLGFTFERSFGAEPFLDITIEIDLGKDTGQSFGTLFEGRDGSGRLRFGAGFASVFNTYHRSERYKLQFFIRPNPGDDRFELKPFPRPSAIPSTYIYDLGERLFVRYRTKKDGLMTYAPSAKEWFVVESGDQHGNFAASVRGKRLEEVNGDVVYGGHVIFDPPDHPIYRYYYYGQGHLFFYRETKTDEGEIKKAVVAIPWTPYDDPIEANRAKEKVLEIFRPPEFPYSFGQLGNEVLNCSNWGGLYSFDGTEWKILRKPQKGVSYQIYTMVTYGDRLLMGQYPTGFFFEYDGNEVKTLKSWPPVPEGASPSARELQTAMIYRGELFAGVWPWAELWKLNPDNKEWILLGRLFDQPKVHSKPIHPYEEEAKAAGLVLNQLGQRLTSMVPYDGGLVMGTSWKGGETLMDPNKIKGLSKQQIEEFGDVHFLKMPGNLEALVSWKDDPITLRFFCGDGRMKIYQNGSVIADCTLDAKIEPDLSEVDIQWGEGVFGRFRGNILNRKM